LDTSTLVGVPSSQKTSESKESGGFPVTPEQSPKREEGDDDFDDDGGGGGGAPSESDGDESNTGDPPKTPNSFDDLPNASEASSGCPSDSDNPEFPREKKTDESSSSGDGKTAPGVTDGVAMGSKTSGQFGYNRYEAIPMFEEHVTQDEKGDKLNDVPTIPGGEKGTMRPRFGMEFAQKVVPSAEEQIKSDIRFDMFDTVAPGFGEGTDNKLFVMEQNRDGKIIYADPMFAPGSDIGPEAGVQVSSWKLQRTMPTEKMALYSQSAKTNLQLIASIVQRKESTNLLGDDIGYYSTESSKGLKRARESPFEPVVNNAMQFHSVKTPCGADLGAFQSRLVTDAMRYPRHLSSYTNGMGGPTLNKRRSLEIILR
jgi:hypothetical protein